MTDAPVGVADGTSRDDAGASREAVESFWSKGRLLAPVVGPSHRGTRVKSWYGGATSVNVVFGDFDHESSIWMTLGGLESLVGELQATLVRARIARENAPLVPLDDSDIPF